MPRGNPNPSPGTRWKKGQSGNPNGRPKLPDLKEALAKAFAEEQKGVNALDATIAAIRNKAMQGDTRATELLLNYAFGKPKQAIDVDHTSGGQPIPSAIRVELVPPADD